jgi:mRNA interferase RelE/StbE
LAWTVDFTVKARLQLDRMQRAEATRIQRFLLDRVATAENPRLLGTALKGSEFGGYWRYRVGDYRVVCEIQDDRMVIIAINIGHRREIYR